MKAFRFPLQAVLTIRQNQENKALESFAFAQSEFQKAAARHHSIQREIEDTLDLRRGIMRKAANSGEIQQIQQGLRALQLALRKSEAELQKLKVQLDEKSKVLMEARKKREIVDKLHDKQLAQHEAEAARMEQKALDELAALKSVGNFALKWK